MASSCRVLRRVVTGAASTTPYPGVLGLLALLQLVEAEVDDTLPLIATGGLSTGHGIAAVLAAGAAAAQLGTAFLLCPEAGTNQAHREMIRQNATPTALTRAFTGRTARGISNRFLREHTPHAPSAYPEIHHLTAPLRSAARAEGDADGFTFGQDRPTRLLNQPQQPSSS
jgi:nitronate monooxygenase